MADLPIRVYDQPIRSDNDLGVVDAFRAGSVRIVLVRLGRVVDAREDGNLELFGEGLEANLLLGSVDSS